MVSVDSETGLWLGKDIKSCSSILFLLTASLAIDDWIYKKMVYFTWLVLYIG